MFIGEWFRKLTYLARQQRMDDELDEELRLHVAMKAEDVGAARARRDVGNLTHWKETSHEARGFPAIESVWRDLRFGLRMLRKDPGLTVTATVSLALGLGATVAFFSLLNSLLFKTLPVPKAGQLASVTRIGANKPMSQFTYPAFRRLRELSSQTMDLFAYTTDGAELLAGETRSKVNLAVVSGNYFDILGLHPARGRLLAPEDDRLNAPGARHVIISHRLWIRLYGGSDSVVGKKILLNSLPFVVAGVTPETFFGVEVGEYPDITLTFAGQQLLRPEDKMMNCDACYWLSMMGRLKPGVSLRQAQPLLASVWHNVLRDTMPGSYSAFAKADYYAETISLVPAATGISDLRARFVKPLFLLLAMTLAILLLSCFNVANLLLTRSLARERELAVRLSIGATRTRLLRQLLIESTLLAAGGLAGGWGVFQLCTRGLLQFMSSGGEQVYLDAAVDWRLLFFVLGLTLVTILLFSLLPALRATRRVIRGVLAESSTSLAATARLGKIMLAGQLALSLTLVVAASLLSRSLYQLRTFDAGFRRDHLIIASADLPNNIAEPQQQRLVDSLLRDIRQMPGVRAASASFIVPLGSSSMSMNYTAEGFVPRSRTDYLTSQNIVSSGYFETIGTRFVAGRDFTEADDKQMLPVAIVNEAFARHYWQTRNVIGRRFRAVEVDRWLTVVGVVQDARYATLEMVAPRTAYLPLKQHAIANWTKRFEIWTNAPPLALTTGIGHLFRQAKEGSFELETFSHLIDHKLLYRRLVSVLAACFAALGLLISAIGIYGMAAYSVTRRTKEVGIRTALGATPAGVLKLILSEQAIPICLGLAIGVAGALLLGRLLQSWLFGIHEYDIMSYVTSIVLLGATAAVATLVPSWHVTKIEPLRSLRHE